MNAIVELYICFPDDPLIVAVYEGLAYGSAAAAAAPLLPL